MKKKKWQYALDQTEPTRSQKNSHFAYQNIKEPRKN